MEGVAEHGKIVQNLRAIQRQSETEIPLPILYRLSYSRQGLLSIYHRQRLAAKMAAGGSTISAIAPAPIRQWQDRATCFRGVTGRCASVEGF